MSITRTAVLALCAIFILGATQASAEIKLKKSFFKGWQYSVDGYAYQKVGNSGTGLKLAMKDNDEAVALMNKYKSTKTWAAITGYPGGFLIGWPIGGYIGSGEWKDGFSTMLYIGAPLVVVSIILESSANKKLKRAVQVYNGDDGQSLGFMFNVRPPESGQPGACFVGLRYGF